MTEAGKCSFSFLLPQSFETLKKSAGSQKSSKLKYKSAWPSLRLIPMTFNVLVKGDLKRNFAFEAA